MVRAPNPSGSLAVAKAFHQSSTVDPLPVSSVASGTMCSSE